MMANGNSKASHVHASLRNEILLGKIEPGAVIGEKAIADRFGVSRTPVRQAFQMLEADGLVNIQDGSGTFVTSVSLRDIEDAYQIRRALEISAIEGSIQRVELAELEELTTLFVGFIERLEDGCVDKAFFEEMAFADWRLHDLILTRCGNSLMHQTAGRITLLLRRYQYTHAEGYLRANKEHVELLHCMQDGDVCGARALLNEHLRVRM